MHRLLSATPPPPPPIGFGAGEGYGATPTQLFPRLTRALSFTPPPCRYLRSEKTHLSSAVSRLSREQIVCLHPNKEGLNAYGAVWSFVLKNPSLRYESMGQPVQANTELIIRHKQTNECLSCNFNQTKKVVSHFGAEQEITASTKMTRAKVEAPENVWVVAMK